MNKITISIVIINLVFLQMFTGCDFPEKPQGKSVDKLNVITPDHVKRLEIEKLSEPLEFGLYKMTIDDTVHILIYRGSESVSLIQINYQ